MQQTGTTLDAPAVAPRDMPQTDLGTVHAVRGAVVDVVFTSATLPPINTALQVLWDMPTPLILEVHSHLDVTTLRAVAFQNTAGLARGVRVQTRDGPVAVPVGEAVLGRLLDVVGTPQDDGPSLARLEIDPWAEASELAAMSEGPAHKRLRALIARFHDVPTLGPDQGKAISALLDLLPRSRSATNPTPPDQPGTPRRFALGVPIYWYIAGFLLLGWIVNLAQFQ